MRIFFPSLNYSEYSLVSLTNIRCRAFERAIKLDPDDPITWLNFAIVCLRGNFRDRAQEAFDTFTKSLGDSENSEDLLQDDEVQSNIDTIQEILGN